MTVLEELEKERKDNFKAEIRKNTLNQTYLCITHNGHQWTGIGLNCREMTTVIELLSNEVKNENTE